MKVTENDRQRNGGRMRDCQIKEGDRDIGRQRERGGRAIERERE